MSTMGERIRSRREELGMSQEELALKIGYKSRSTVNKIEADTRQLHQSKIVAIAKALETTATWILGIDDETENQKAELCELFRLCYGKDAYL